MRWYTQAASFTGSPLNPKGSTPLKASNGQSPSTANMGAAVAKVYFQEEVVDVMEDCGSVTLVVRRSGHMGEVVSINYETADISATAGKDYEAQAGTLTFQVELHATPCTAVHAVVLHHVLHCNAVLYLPRPTSERRR